MYKKKQGRKSKAPPKAEFDYRYYVLDLSAREMGKLYGVSENTIYNWAVHFRKEEELEA